VTALERDEQTGPAPRATNASDGALPVQMTKSAAGPGAYSPEVLVLAPSRELVMQIEQEAQKFTAATGIKTCLAELLGLGVQSFGLQICEFGALSGKR